MNLLRLKVASYRDPDHPPTAWIIEESFCPLIKFSNKTLREEVIEHVAAMESGGPLSRRSLIIYETFMTSACFCCLGALTLWHAHFIHLGQTSIEVGIGTMGCGAGRIHIKDFLAPGLWISILNADPDP